MHLRFDVPRRCLLAMVFLGATACGGGGTAPNSGGGGGGGGGGGPVGSISVGNTFFQSAHNGTTNPAIDTVPANTTVTWTWSATGSHSVRSTGSTFTSSTTMSANGSTHTFLFTTPGTYEYDCAVHGSLMTGRIVVQ